MRIVIDPYLSDSLAARYPEAASRYRRLVPPPIAPDELGNIDAVFCTHHHTDHMDGGTLRPLAARLPNLRFVVPAASRSLALERTGAREDQLLCVDAGQKHALFGGRLSLHVTRASHETLERDADGQHRFLGFGLTINDIRIFHSGDTVPFDGQSDEIRAFSPDLALLPVNGRSEILLKMGVPGNMSLTEALELTASAEVPAMMAHHFGMFSFNTANESDIDDAVLNAPFQMFKAAYQQALEPKT